MKRFLIIAAAVCALASCNRGLVREPATPEQMAEFDKCFPAIWGHGCDELHSLMVLQHGKVIYERYATGHSADELHVMWSSTKTFNATAVGFAAQDGLLSVEDPIVGFFDAEDLPDCGSDTLRARRLSQVKIKHLLSMSSGFAVTPVNTRIRNGEQFDPVKYCLAAEFVDEPGAGFRYNALDSYLLSVIVTKVTGKSEEDYLAEKLFEPLGIRRWHYDKGPMGYNCGAWGLFIETESYAKMGQFFLNKGEWNGRQLLNPEWFEAAMAPQIYQEGTPDLTNDWLCGYGYQMWCCTKPGSARLDGAWGQMCLICPDKDAVIAFTAHAGDNRWLLKTIWNQVYDNI